MLVTPSRPDFIDPRRPFHVLRKTTPWGTSVVRFQPFAYPADLDRLGYAVRVEVQHSGGEPHQFEHDLDSGRDDYRDFLALGYRPAAS
jgi:hypothetical protein